MNQSNYVHLPPAIHAQPPSPPDLAAIKKRDLSLSLLHTLFPIRWTTNNNSHGRKPPRLATPPLRRSAWRQRIAADPTVATLAMNQSRQRGEFYLPITLSSPLPFRSTARDNRMMSTVSDHPTKFDLVLHLYRAKDPFFSPSLTLFPLVGVAAGQLAVGTITGKTSDSCRPDPGLIRARCSPVGLNQEEREWEEERKGRKLT